MQYGVAQRGTLHHEAAAQLAPMRGRVIVPGALCTCRTVHEEQQRTRDNPDGWVESCLLRRCRVSWTRYGGTPPARARGS
jgi:hypothetical protein